RDLLMGLLRADGLEPTAWPRLPDDPRQVEIALRDAACAFDLVFTCGAVSAGEKDHIPAVLAQFGQIHFWKVKMRPGMPLLLASMDQARFLGLPGNPVSVLATYLSFGRALIDGLQGRVEPPAEAARPVGRRDREEPPAPRVRARAAAQRRGRGVVGGSESGHGFASIARGGGFGCADGGDGGCANVGRGGGGGGVALTL
ncbi:molybdopterin binding domain protein, partial [Catenibacterium mitsuokai DSM 15897]